MSNTNRRQFLQLMGMTALTSTMKTDIAKALAIPANNRTGTIRDVMLDTCAAIAAQFLVYFFLRMRSHRPTQVAST